MSPSFGRFVSGVDIIAPKPTTFKIDLINGQDFSIKYLGNKKWDVKVSGKKYNSQNIGEVERASQAVANLLELSYTPKEETNTPTPSEETPKPNPSPEETAKGAELATDLSAAGEEVLPPEETPTPEETPAA
jgi:hypothetical protein